MWGALCCISFSFAYFFVPEMKGLSLEQVDKMMEEVTARKSASWVPHSTFAEEMGLTQKGVNIGDEHNSPPAEKISHEITEKSAV